MRNKRPQVVAPRTCIKQLFIRYPNLQTIFEYIAIAKHYSQNFEVTGLQMKTSIASHMETIMYLINYSIGVVRDKTLGEIKYISEWYLVLLLLVHWSGYILKLVYM